MIVVTMTNCPPRLRGDLTIWLQEISAGVFVGNLSTRVREALWDRICKYAEDGSVTMVYTTKSAQGYLIRTANTKWVPIEYDGITLMRRPSPPRNKKKEVLCLDANPTPSSGTSATQQRNSTDVKLANGEGKRTQKRKEPSPISGDYVVIDIETTGLDAKENDIIEIAALRIQGHTLVEQFSQLLQISTTVPMEIAKLTGISDALLYEKGVAPRKALKAFLQFIGDASLVIHNAKFDLGFLNALCHKQGIPEIKNEYRDTLTLSRKLLRGLDNYRLPTIAKHLSIEQPVVHRALTDSMITMELFEKLNKISPVQL